MAISTLDTSSAQGGNSTGSLNTLTATWDYDSTAQTVGLTVTGQGTAYVATMTTSKGSWTVDCMKGTLAGLVLNMGRVVVLGPGSLIGQTAPVTSKPTGVVVTWTWGST